MQVTLVLLGVWVCVVASTAQRLNFYEGDICKQQNGSLWTCKKGLKCPKAAEDLQKHGKRPEMCHFSGSKRDQLVVCCKPEREAPPIGAISKEKCKEYAKSVYVEIPSPIGDGFIYQDTCAAMEPLITKGKDAAPREYPHMALIIYDNPTESLCGGSLISERFVLSAAHCSNAGYRNSRRPAKRVRLGDYDFQSKVDDNRGLAKSMEYEIIETIKHPDYKSPSLYHDIALFKLASDVGFDDYIRPICLQTEHQFPKTYGIITGWGRLEYGGPRKGILQKANATFIPRKECNDHYVPTTTFHRSSLPNGIKDESMLCAGGSGSDTCQADSGGPIQIRLVEPYCMYAQVGVTSGGLFCGGSAPAIYTRVSHYVPWIESIVWPN